MEDIYENSIEYNPNQERKILIVFDMFADMLSNKDLQQVVIKWINSGRKLNNSLAMITQSYFAALKNIR